jgi:hypothetical protein
MNKKELSELYWLNGELVKNYRTLADDVVLQAVHDYRQAIKKLKKAPGCEFAIQRKQGVECFFRSVWFSSLTELDPELLIKKLCAEVD